MPHDVPPPTPRARAPHDPGDQAAARARTGAEPTADHAVDGPRELTVVGSLADRAAEDLRPGTTAPALLVAGAGPREHDPRGDRS